jgi:hypothetical protein
MDEFRGVFSIGEVVDAWKSFIRVRGDEAEAK